MNNKSNYNCRKCFQPFKMTELSEIMQLCQYCQTSSGSNSFKQCKYCKGDFKISITGDICPKCKNQLGKHGEPSNCTICKLQMVYGNAVICIRCSHYRSKFGEARECDNCSQICAFYKDNISREKVDGKVLCWLCTYYYKSYKSRLFKNTRDKLVDVSKPAEGLATLVESPMIRTDSSNSLLNAEPVFKRSRVDDDCGLTMFSNDSVYNEHLLKVNSLQEDIKQFRRRIITKDNELLAKDNLITGLKADLLQKDKDYRDKELAMKDRWDNERQTLTEKIRALQRENVRIMKSGKKRRPVDIGLQYLTKNPLTRVTQCAIGESNEVVEGGTNSKEVSSGEESPTLAV